MSERDSRKKFKTWEHIQNDATLRSGFFQENALGDGPVFWIFFQDSRIRFKKNSSRILRTDLIKLGISEKFPIKKFYESRV